MNGNHITSSGSSRIIEQADFNGESVTLNGGTVSGANVAGYTTGLDVLVISHSGLGSAPTADKYPWFSPFGSGGTFLMISTAAAPDLSRSDAPAMLDLFFIDPSSGGSYHRRQGLIEGISTTPFPVPEPGSWAMMGTGLAVLLQLARRRSR